AAVVIASGMGAKILDSARQFASASGLSYGGVLHKPFRRKDVAEVLAAGSHASDNDGIVLDVFGDWDSDRFEETLRRAVARDELGVAFQPKVACVSGRLVGYEALVRWSHPTLGAIPPDAFIPRAERLRIISIVTDSVAATAMAWFASARAHTEERLAINISAVELTGPDLGTRLLAECRRSGVDPSRIVLEVTETSAMANPTESLEVLTRLRLDGFQLSIDDFGTGYSSMAQLSTMPFTEVKIDRSFVRNLGSSLPAEVMVKSMLQLSRGLGVECVAEGVETAAALEVLSELGCDFAQGYHIGFPMTESDLEAWILAHDSGR
ncbi:MAG: EAL domain-containing protein, partial [Demequinaceae bacterium]|nr:EAL domain-containing protein [Demequinaceae bacterium]